MKKKFKKYISVLLATVLATGCLSAVVAFADGDVAINETNFPDANFRAFVEEQYDTDGNKSLSADERSTTIMSLTNNEIKNLKGIEFFTDVKVLRCANIKLEQLDVSALKDLTTLTCQGNKLTNLDLMSNFKLKTLNCAVNELASIDLVSSELTSLDCHKNKFENLDISLLTNLQTLVCYQNELKSLDLSSNKKLKTLNCTYNHLTSLDLSNNTSLSNVTNAMIGNQTVSLKANAQGSAIFIPFENSGLDSSNYVSSTLEDCGDGSGFYIDSFVAYDVSDFDNGIVYYCNTKLAGSENMKVDVSVSRDFHQVNFYSDSEYTSLIGKAFADDGKTVTAPSITNPPQCKALDSWSDSLDNVTQDKNIYANWKDAHSYKTVSFANDTATVKCSACGDTFTLSFIDAVNTSKGDEKYSPYLDLTGDGVINAKDYALLNKLK